MIKAKIPQKTRDALDELAPNRAFAEVVSWLKEALDSTRKENDILEGIPLTRNQGCAIVLDKILKTVEATD